MVAFSIRIPDELNERIEQICRITEWSKNKVANKLIERGVIHWLAENRPSKKI